MKCFLFLGFTPSRDEVDFMWRLVDGSFHFIYKIQTFNYQ